MEQNTLKTILDAGKLALIREFFAWILVGYLMYWIKVMDNEKTTILIETTKTQTELLKQEKETDLKLLEITNQSVNKFHEKNNPNSND